jgi:hypothetical protein
VALVKKYVMVVQEVVRLGAIGVMLLVLLATEDVVYIATWVTINVKSVMEELESVVMVVLVVGITVINSIQKDSYI